MIGNTLENKAKLFALYWGQKILRFYYEEAPELKTFDCTLNSPFMSILSHSHYLSVKSLSSITDEDAIEVAKIRFHYGKYKEFEMSVKDVPFYKSVHVCTERFHGTLYVPHDASDLESHVCDMHGSITYVVDYLRSRGYLLPWMGLTCEDIINYGWAKLKED